MAATISHTFSQPRRRPLATPDHSGVFEDWFSRCRGLLHFTACRVLGGRDGAELAVENCRITASRNPPRFDREGAFRSWLLRVLINEALAILHRDRSTEAKHQHTDSGPRRKPQLSLKQKEESLMTTYRTRLNAFALSTGQGRTREPLNVLGAEVLVKLANADTNGAAAIFHQAVPPMSGPPLHRHSREDEWFYVLDGEIVAEINSRRSVLQAGASAFAPRGTAHTFQNFRDAPVQMLVMVMPGDFHRFFEELSSLNKGLPAPDLVRTEQLMKSYGIELLGPPLS
jgi:mannose-6-phosphate isomerase-like protein (cupin superfamily)